MNKRKNPCVCPVLLLATFPLANVASAAPPAFVSVSSHHHARFSLDDGDPLFGGAIYEAASFEHGQGLEAAASFNYAYLSALQVEGRTRQGLDVDLRAYGAGLTVQAAGYTGTGIEPYITLAGGVGHMETVTPLSDDHNAYAEGKLSLGIRLQQRVDIGGGVTAQVIGYPGETVANLTTLFLSASLSFR